MKTSHRKHVRVPWSWKHQQQSLPAACQQVYNYVLYFQKDRKQLYMYAVFLKFMIIYKRNGIRQSVRGKQSIHLYKYVLNTTATVVTPNGDCSCGLILCVESITGLPHIRYSDIWRHWRAVCVCSRVSLSAVHKSCQAFVLNSSSHFGLKQRQDPIDMKETNI